VIVSLEGWRLQRKTNGLMTQKSGRESHGGIEPPGGVNLNLVLTFVGQMMAMEGELIGSTCNSTLLSGFQAAENRK
jgi:hypothetical protein